MFRENIWVSVPKRVMTYHYRKQRESGLDIKRHQIMMIWSFKRKRHPDGSLNKYKARLCCHGGQQQWCFMFAKGSVGMSLSFKGPDHHDLLLADILAILSLSSVMLYHFLPWDQRPNLIAEHGRYFHLHCLEEQLLIWLLDHLLDRICLVV